MIDNSRDAVINIETAKRLTVEDSIGRVGMKRTILKQ